MPVARLMIPAFVLGSFLAGCGPAKLDTETKLTVEPLGAGSLVLEPQSKPQTITVEFSSAASDVTVYLIKSEDKDEELKVVPSKDVTLGKKSGKNGSFATDVPANTRTRVLVLDAKKMTDVTLHVTNRK